jgi:hypothetical protein
VMSRYGAFDTCKDAIDPFWASLTVRTLTGGPYERVKKPQTGRSNSQGQNDNLQRILSAACQTRACSRGTPSDQNSIGVHFVFTNIQQVSRRNGENPR